MDKLIEVLAGIFLVLALVGLVVICGYAFTMFVSEVLP
jgi:hypothetical protein